MPDTRDEERCDEVRDEREDNRKNNLGPWILGSAAVLAIPLLLCCFPRGCRRDCKDCNEPAPKKEIVFVKDTVVVEQYNVGGDMVNIKGDNNDVNFTKGNGNNVASRNSGTQTWERATRPQPKKVVKKTVVQPEQEPKPKPEPEVVEEHCTVIIKYKVPCNSR